VHVRVLNLLEAGYLRPEGCSKENGVNDGGCTGRPTGCYTGSR